MSVLDSLKKIWGRRRGERRKHRRRHRFYVAEIEINKKKKFVNVTNLSKEGIGISLDEDLGIGSKVKLAFTHEFTKGDLKGKKIDMVFWAKVQWVKSVHSKIDELEYDTGLELIFIPDELSAAYSALLIDLK